MSSPTPIQASAQALYFDSGGRPLFGWLHTPSGRSVCSVGLLICKPFGYEATCSHRSVRTFAETACSLGIPTLRFDYLGTGDSAEIDPQADQIAVWSHDVEAAIAELQQRTGVRQVILLGIRLGGLIASLVSQRNSAVSALILIAPIVSGARYVRQLLLTRLAGISANQAESGSETAEVAPDHSAEASIEVSGFPLAAATLKSLKGIDLMSMAIVSPVRHMLIIDGGISPNALGWAQKLAAGPWHSSYLTLPGLVEMIFRSPLRAVVPLAVVDAIREWLLVRIGEPMLSVDSSPSRPSVAVMHEHPQAKLEGPPGARIATIAERPVFIAADSLLFGIVTEPSPSERRRRGVILLNSGADNHIGANRLHVSLARRWVQHGYVVLRLDLGGLGDSSTRENGTDDEVFPTTAVDEIRIAMEFLRKQYGVEHMTLAGVCSGAYHVLRAAVANLPVNLMLMINPQNYFWKEGSRIDELQLVEVVRYPTVYPGRVFSGAAWKKLLGGKVSITRVLRVYIQRMGLAIESIVRDVARSFGIKLPHDVGSELQTVAARGVRIAFFFARNEPGVDLLRLQAGSEIRRLGDNCRIHILDCGDHIFSVRSDREKLENVLTQELLSQEASAQLTTLQPASEIKHR